MDSVIKTTAQLGVHLRGRRRALHLTQAEAASKIGLKQKRLSKLELNPELFTAAQLLGLANALGLELILRERDATVPTAKDEW